MKKPLKYQGHDAYLLEEKLADVFQCTVGNISSDQTVVIKINTSLNSNMVLILNHIDLNVTCRMTSSILAIESPSHHISTKVIIDGDTKVAKITLAEDVTYLEKDFILVVKSLDLYVPRYYSWRSSNITLQPKPIVLCLLWFPNKTLVELIFVIDRSGSMEGEPIQKAAQTLQLLLRSLPELMWCRLVLVTIHCSRKVNFIPRSPLLVLSILDANYGDTEIYDPLKWAFENSRFDMQTSVFLLTDGEVWNVETLVELIRTNVEQKKDNLRLFSIGIGNSISHNLVESVARAGKGYAQYVTISERMDKKIIGMIKNTIKPPVKDYKIEAETKQTISIFGKNPSPPPQDPIITDTKTKQAPFLIPPIYSGVRFVIYCMLAKGFSPNKKIMLTAQSPDGPMKPNIHLNPVMSQGSKIHTLAARKPLRDLEDSASLYSQASKEQVVYLGITFNLASKYTSFLAIDESGNKSVGKLFHPEKREVPIQGAFFSSYMSSSQAASFYRSFPQTVSYYGSSSQSVSPYRSFPQVASYSFENSIARYLLTSNSLVDESPLMRVSRSERNRKLITRDQRKEIHSILNFKESKIEALYEFLKFQSFNGEFNSAGFYPCFDKKEAKDFKEIGIDNEKILCTALAIEYLEVVMFGQFKDECEMCWEKANKAPRKLVNEDEFDDVLKKVRDWTLKWVETN
ncbi:16149_t:CDS:2 [Acaulospora morrowiae]|uniref:16149_t:CDS:1 n=1 Tax=Acaulospora morrowiae TaxID=94023 RepID=A0A9N9BF85_9GLOM|nr:16149_t:CDS:2 [Acaulospora morrowiae]